MKNAPINVKVLTLERLHLNGNRVGLKDYSGKETVYTYDALDRISKVTDNGHELIDYLYNDDGTLKKMVTGGNIVTEYT